ncbi:MULTISPECIES: LysR family transcriptional regulator [Klebsiella]|uniref:LysR family transcriptional regulator n=1 Tax=Klebsiella TaxID=570 RepID=UPI000667B2B2|nr:MULTISPECIES: LysR family transcriptional regulator [Klebsiella]EKU6609066.1 LysR family transcriptional regulator [Klebsiella aerogenes]EKW5858268.1 LysR family transcriptional regulator [Klebsiella aerogenes]EKZ5852675.1 LysR family transcriptional regulator [Klebsiella aerogenes]EKZ6547534.1 LysR family transcriptional regulator [Klebsiella aerogenes]EKZ6673976.1 LysR family transcriptional regulator [Klebsiella aerogenes]
MRSDLNAIPVFVAVVECGNFAQAAEKLSVTRSAVGKTISRLEQRLGVALFQRTTRRQALTEEGEVFYLQSRRALDNLRDAENEIQRGKTQVQGRLRISLPVLFGQRCVAPILFPLSQRYPELKLELSFSDRQVNLFEEGFDMAIRIGALSDSSFLKARRLGQHGMTLCASPLYLRHRPAPQTPEELHEHLTIGYLYAGQMQKWHLRDAQGAALAFRPQPGLAMDDFAAIAAAAKSGLGIAWLPDWLVADELARGELQQILPSSVSGSFAISAVWPEAAWVPQKIRVVVDELLARLPQQLAGGKNQEDSSASG